jgi:hypothetical protein
MTDLGLDTIHLYAPWLTPKIREVYSEQETEEAAKAYKRLKILVDREEGKMEELVRKRTDFFKKGK